MLISQKLSSIACLVLPEGQLPTHVHPPWNFHGRTIPTLYCGANECMHFQPLFMRNGSSVRLELDVTHFASVSICISPHLQQCIIIFV